MINSSLSSYIKLVENDRTRIKTNYNNLTDSYSLSGLNIKGNVNDYITMIENFDNHLKHTDERKNLSILFYGPPGTGKTEFVKYIATHLDRKVAIKSPSDILSKYVGDTERNISDLFQRAEREKEILFIDETDSILRSRGMSTNSWEITMVNELLVRMENFHGIFFAATNRFSDLDSAVLRRFNLKIALEYLDAYNIPELFKIYFGDYINIDITGDLIDKISSIKYLTPGDFKSVYRGLYLLDKERVTIDLIIKALIDEVKVKEKLIGKQIGFK